MSTPEPKSQGFLENPQIAEITLPFAPLLSSRPETEELPPSQEPAWHTLGSGVSGSHKQFQRMKTPCDRDRPGQIKAAP